MRILTKMVWVVGVLALAAPSALPKPKASTKPDEDQTAVVVLKNGRHQTIRLADVARIEIGPPVTIVFNDARRQAFDDIAQIEFNSSSKAASKFGQEAHFLGVWKVGIGGGNSGTFLITLKPDGVAKKTIGSIRGKWIVVNGEARCSWDDGWTDVIRKAGHHWEKAAYAPGSSLDDDPSSVAEAVYTEPN